MNSSHPNINYLRSLPQKVLVPERQHQLFLVTIANLDP